MRLTTLACIAFATCAFTSCGDHLPLAPVWPVYVSQIRPPEEYRQWYAHAEACAGMKGNYDQVTWWVSDKPWGNPQAPTYGDWLVVHDSLGYVKRIEIHLSGTLWTDSMLVIHESLHDILWRNGWEPKQVRAGASRDEQIVALHPRPVFRRTKADKGCAPIFYPWFKE